MTTRTSLDVLGRYGNDMGIATDLHTPYTMAFNLSLARQIPGGLTIEASYAGRLSRSLLMQIDAGGWAILFKDPKSGITSHAARAAPTAASTSSGPARGSSAHARPENGLTVANVEHDRASTHAPLRRTRI